MVRLIAVLVGAASTAAAAAQTPDTTRRPTPLAAVTVTATRTTRTAFDTPQPVTVFDSVALADLLANGIADAFFQSPGLDASGVGANQRRPEIRGMRGQRILLLSDGVRLNNARRQQDFGELPALAGVGSNSRVEVVRGPASVLYGTDAIGGVVNVISRGEPRSTPAGDVHGNITYRMNSAGRASVPLASVAARAGRLGIRADAAVREAGEYDAPAGSFGNITLADDARVRDSGVRDRSGSLALDLNLTATSRLFVRLEGYSARDAGFGYVDPALLGAGQPTIRLRYPDQDYTRYTLAFRTEALGRLADRAELTTYVQRNTRHFTQYIVIPIGATASVTTNTFNYTDLGTAGGRAEFVRRFGRHALTYGVDAFRDESDNTDSSRTVVAGFGPPSTRTSNVPSVPNATFASAGAFAQLDVTPWDRLTLITGIRGQTVSAETRPTPNVTAPRRSGSDRTVVWSANALYRVAPSVNAVAAIGRGFRAPNLVERFFDGPAPEGNGYQRANPGLLAESSRNMDLGLRVRRGSTYGESFVFRNDLSDALKAVATGDTVNRLPVFENRNVSRLRVDGLEALAGVRARGGWDASIGFTRLRGRNISDPGSPVGDSYSSKLTGDVAYRPARDRFTLGYSVRYQGEQNEVIVGANPIGQALPAFTVHSARASLRVAARERLTTRLVLVANNLMNRLYAEFPNASFFRPEPARSVSAALVTTF